MEALVTVVAQESQAGLSRLYPIATVAFYGPTAVLATKVVVAILARTRLARAPVGRGFDLAQLRLASPSISAYVFERLRGDP